MTEENSEILTRAKEKVEAFIIKCSHLFNGEFKQRVVVLGAFDTWPYMDFIARILADLDYVAITSRYIYRKINTQIVRMKTQDNINYASTSYLMSELLDQIIGACSSAIINFSISAAHFIETDWCYNKSKKTLGIAYVRSVLDYSKKPCDYLVITETPVGFYSSCGIGEDTSRNIWDCMRDDSFCPFIKQDISKNVIEYFFRGKNMGIVAVEDLSILKYVIGAVYEDYEKIINLSESYEDILIDDDVIFSNDTLYLFFLLEILNDEDYIKKSSDKILNLLQTMPHFNMGETDIKEFIDKYLVENRYIKHLKKGYVDSDLINDTDDNLYNMLFKRGYVTLEKFDIASQNDDIKKSIDIDVILISLTDKGKKALRLLNEVMSII